MSRYLLIVIVAMVFLPIAFMSTGLLFGILYPFVNSANNDNLPYGNSIQIETDWHEEAKKLSGLPEDWQSLASIIRNRRFSGWMIRV